MMFRIVLLLLVFYINKPANCANILVVNALPSHSHHIWNEIYSLSLVEKGHNVTLISHDGTKVKNPNYTTIVLEDYYEQAEQEYEFEDFAHFNGLNTATMLWNFCHDACLHDVKTKGFETIMNYPEDFKFDLIVWDITAGHCLYPLITKFNNPLTIAISPCPLQHFQSEMFGNQMPFYPYYFAQKTFDKMTFFERLENHLYINLMNWWYKLLYLPAENQIAKNAFKKVNNIKSLEEYESDFILLLSNTDTLWDYAISLSPNIIPVGGLHIKKPKKLPNDLQKLLDDSKNGVIYFALGSNIKSEKLTKLNQIIRVLEKLPHKVLWKIDDKNLNIKLPSNVITSKWYPQNDVLAHKNVILFISHGGALSTQESLYNGVPMVFIPFFFDQYSNSIRLVNRKLGLRIPYTTLTDSNLYEAVMEMLQNPIYRQNSKRISDMAKDQLNRPLDTAVYWTEYVLKYGKLPHLNVVNRNMYFYETIHLDVFLFILFVLLTIVIIVLSILYCCYRAYAKKSNKIKTS